MSVTAFNRRRRELVAKLKRAQTVEQQQAEPVEQPQEEAPEKSKRRKKGGDRDAGD